MKLNKMNVKITVTNGNMSIAYKLHIMQDTNRRYAATQGSKTIKRHPSVWGGETAKKRQQVIFLS